MTLSVGQRVHMLGNVGEVVRIKSELIAAVHFTGKTTEGHFGQIKGGCDCLISNLKPHEPKRKI
jgi:hypothetical protein